MIQAKIHGIEELDEALEGLPKAVASAVIRTALKKAGQPVADLASLNALTHSAKGTFSRSFIVSTTLTKRQRRLRKLAGDPKQQATVFVGSRDPKAHLIEFGTGPHTILRKNARVLASDDAVYGPAVAHPGTAASPVLRPAWDAMRETVMKTLGQLMWEQLEKALKRLRKRAAKLAASA